MSAKQIHFRSDAREKILRGATLLADAVNAANGQYMDLIEAGIIDPAKVVRIALENAASIAGTLLLTEATMTEVPEQKPRLHEEGFPPS